MGSSDFEAEKADRTARSVLTYRSPDYPELVRLEALQGEVTVTLRLLAAVQGQPDPFPGAIEGMYVTRVLIGELHSLLKLNGFEVVSASHKWL